MLDDVTDGVRAMIEQGVADPQRVCTVGVGLGGYAALAGAAFTPEVYACAISVNGFADLPDLISFHRREFRKRYPLLETYLQDHIGPKGSPEVAAKSPAGAASRVRAPILLMHGVDDLVPINQSQTMMKALGGQSPHEFIELAGEDHWLSRSESRIRVLTEMERFLAKHLTVAGEGGD